MLLVFKLNGETFLLNSTWDFLLVIWKFNHICRWADCLNGNEFGTKFLIQNRLEKDRGNWDWNNKEEGWTLKSAMGDWSLKLKKKKDMEQWVQKKDAKLEAGIYKKKTERLESEIEKKDGLEFERKSTK